MRRHFCMLTAPANSGRESSNKRFVLPYLSLPLWPFACDKSDQLQDLLACLVGQLVFGLRRQDFGQDGQQARRHWHERAVVARICHMLEGRETKKGRDPYRE